MTKYLVATALSLCSAALQAAAIPGLYNTGVDDGGTPLAGGAVDPHYSLVFSADPAFPGPDAIVASTIPNGFWLPNSATSKWIAPAADQNFGVPHLPGNYGYQLEFDLSGFDAASALISGMWATDNSGTLYINGALTANVAAGYNVLVPFFISGGFVSGLNYLDFVVNNAECGGCVNPTGLRVDDISGTAALIPEPESYALLIAGLGLLGFVARRRDRGLTPN